jgi:hypothetical protein
MRRPRSKLIGIGELIPQVYPSSEPEEARALRVFAAYGKSVPERVLKNARPVRFHEGVLTVHTSTATWANALSLESPELLASATPRAGDQREPHRVPRGPHAGAAEGRAATA